MTLKQEGAKALFRAYPVTLMMNVPFAFAIVSANENIKVFVKPKEHHNPFVLYFSCAFVAGAIASIITNPMDVIKTKLNTQHHDSTLDKFPKKLGLNKREKIGGNFEIEESETLSEAKYKDIKDATRKLYQKEGIAGFYKGAIPRMLFVAPGVAISWGTYEIFKSLLNREKP